ncbi:MAG: S9 family peptidase [Bacteroidales bacterium]|nr:S9 family peptidase [Bacteroidales bacterium]
MSIRHLTTVFAVFCALSTSLGAQTVLDTHPAQATGRDFTMKDVTVSRTGSPASFSAQWQDADRYMFRDADGAKVSTIAGEVSDYEPAAPDEVRRALPRTARSVTPSGKGAYAFTEGHSLYCITPQGVRLTVAESPSDQITFGQSVSRNEFGIGEGIYWSPSGRRIAFYRKDESRVTDFPILNIKTRTGELVTFKYPMNGMASEHVTLGVYDIEKGTTVYMKVTDFDDERYLTNISWSPDDRYVFIQVLDRPQHHMHLNMYDASTGAFVRNLLNEENDQWVEPYAHLQFLEGTYQFLYSTDNRDGYKNLYLCDTLGTVRRLVNTDAEVTYVANDGRYVYYNSAEVSPVESHLFRVEVRQNRRQELAKARIGAPQRLTFERGWHNVSLSPDRKHFIDSYSSFNVPRVVDLRTTDGKLVRNLFTAGNPLEGFRTGEVRLGTVKSADGLYDNYYRMFLPAGFDPSKKYPVVLYVYGGPHSQMVTDTWLGSVRMWEMLMAQRGYIVYVQDNRGTEHRGAAFEKAINRQCGQAEMADQMVGIDWLRSLPYVDAERIGVHGWSYGGFMTITLITNHPDVFKVAVAGGPVIDWKWYEVMYGERYMDNPDTNPEGFEKTSLINKAKDLKGKLLICQGAIDNTVVWEHSLSFIQECIENNVQVDYFPYPVSEHNVAGAWREHLMQKVTNYFDDYL